MKPECLECEATLTLALERVKRLEEALRARDALLCRWLVEWRHGYPDPKLASETDSILTPNALRPEGT